MDCFHPENMGNLLLGKECYLPATPHGVIELIQRSGIETSGKNCVIVGRSNIVGKPLSMLMLQKSINATVTVCHSRTENLPQVCRRADILIVAIGQPEMITAEYVKEGATVIDVGIHRLDAPDQPKGYRLCGDVKFDEVSKICGAITPTPGGTGAMTTACLLQNTLRARLKRL
jgi:methylenetetrahydrofolate dehydrogenase (NADP+)/methenyltetrahydrofolate cyclohydrolase